MKVAKINKITIEISVVAKVLTGIPLKTLDKNENNKLYF